MAKQKKPAAKKAADMTDDDYFGAPASKADVVARTDPPKNPFIGKPAMPASPLLKVSEAARTGRSQAAKPNAAAPPKAADPGPNPSEGPRARPAGSLRVGFGKDDFFDERAPAKVLHEEAARPNALQWAEAVAALGRKTEPVRTSGDLGDLMAIGIRMSQADRVRMLEILTRLLKEGP